MRVKSVPDVKFCLVFRCETLSVPVMRRVLGDTLRGLGVDEESVYDILLAATEACTNVLQHGGREVRGYAVVTSLGAVGCQVEVADEGVGLAAAPTRRTARSRRRSRLRSPSCPSRAAAWPSCGPAWTTSPWTAARARHGRDHAQAHQLVRRRPAAPATARQLDPAAWPESSRAWPGYGLSCGADWGHHFSWVA